MKSIIYGIIDGILRAIILIITCNILESNIISEMIDCIMITIIGILLANISSILIYKKSKQKIWLNYWLSIMVEIFLIGFEIFSGFFGNIFEIFINIQRFELNTGDFWWIIYYLFFWIIETNILRIVLLIIRFISEYKGIPSDRS